MANTLIGRLTPTNNMGGTLTNESRLTGQLGGVGAAVTYASLPDKPSINNVVLVGNKTTSDLNISYNDLRDQPAIPDVGEIDERLDDLEGDITSLSGRVTTTEGDITSLSGRVTTAEGNITTLQGDTSALDGRLTTAEGNISSLGGRVTTAEGDITSLGGRVTTAEGEITSLGGRVTTAEGEITDLQGDMSQAQNDIIQLNSSLMNIKNTKQATATIPITSAGSIYTTDIDISNKPAIFQLLKGFAITSSNELVPLQIFFNNSNSLHIRVRALATSNGNLIIYYI